jgi:hypothetical protein
MAWFHSHRWKVTGVTQLQWLHTKCPCTEILMVCDCGEAKTINLTGQWSLEQLQPAPNRVAADTEFFKKLGVKI